MNASEILRIVDTIHRDKGLQKEVLFEAIEQGILSALRKNVPEEDEIRVDIDRGNGEPRIQHNGRVLDPDESGRVAAQTAKQVIIQKIREAERDALFDEFTQQKGDLVTGTVTRFEGGVAQISLGKVEAILPRSEQIPGESHRVNERIRAVILDVRKSGSRVKIVLSRVHTDMVRRLFELEIPEVGERIIEVRSLAREAGHRSKVAVSCIDSTIDCVGACVGVRGARIKSIIEELGGERIDIVRWNDSLQVLIPNALQPAEVEDVILCPMLGRVIVLVRDDQLSLAIGRKGQNVRLASKLVGWDIEVMTRVELDNQLDRSVDAFANVPHFTPELAESLVSQGFFSFDDLSVIEPDQLAELGGLTEEQCDEIVAYADEESLRAEQAEKRRKEETRLLDQQQRAMASRPAVATPDEKSRDEKSAVEKPSVAEIADAGENSDGDSPMAGETETEVEEVSAAEDQPADGGLGSL